MTLHERASELNRIMGGYDKDSAASWLKEGNKPSSDGIKIHQRSNVCSAQWMSQPLSRNV